MKFKIDDKILYIPSAKTPKTRSVYNCDYMTTSKVPKFIKEKECAKSMQQSSGSKNSELSRKSANLRQLVGDEVES